MSIATIANTPKKSKIRTVVDSARREDGAVDPILILGAIAVLLVLTVGGFFAVTGWVNNAKDMNAQGDVDRIALVEEAHYTKNGTYTANLNTLKTDTSLGVNFAASQGVKYAIIVSGGGYTIGAQSETGKVYVRVSGNSKITEYANAAAATGTGKPFATAPTWAE